MSRDLVINSIIIDGLRGFNKAQTIDFHGTHAFISGNMGTGKTSTLCAIEWALFGDIANISSEGSTHPEYVNSNKMDQKARVTLKLKDDDGEYIVHREKYASKKKSDLTFTTPEGEFVGDDADNHIFSIFGTFEDFHRSVFLHQEAVRAILTEKIEDRDSALDRLFGLEKTRQLMSAIPIRDVRNYHEELEIQKNKIEERIKGATEHAEIDMERARKEAVELGLKESELILPEGIQRYNAIVKCVIDVSDDCGIEKPTFMDATTTQDVSKGLDKVKKTIKLCRMQITSNSKFTELQNEWSQKNKSKGELTEAITQHNTSKDEYDAMKEEWGSEDEITKKEIGFKEKDEQLKTKRETVDSTSKLVADGIDVFSKQMPNTCPVCESKVSPEQVLSRLQTKISVELMESLSKIDEERKDTREKLLQIVDQKKQLGKAINTIKEAKERMVSAEKILAEIIKSKSTGEQLLKEVDENLSTLQIESNKAENALIQKNNVLQGIDDDTELCKTIVKVLEKESEYGRMKETFSEEDSQITTLKDQIEKMSALYSRLQRLSDAIATAQINLARGFMEKGANKRSEYYSTLCGHPYYNSLKIDIGQRNAQGVQKNTYSIRAFNNTEGKETLVSTRFSTGQMNCAALSIFLSLTSVLDRRLKFIILDDPSQNLDKEHKKSLVKVLSDLTCESQLIIATQDDELKEVVELGFLPQNGYTTFRYEGWNKEGPIIKISKKGE